MFRSQRDALVAALAALLVTQGAVQRRSVLSDSDDLINFMRQHLTLPHDE